MANFNADNHQDLVTAPESRGSSKLKLLNAFWAYDENYRGGVNVALGER
ncbi:hypothetical protein KJ903_03645 [Patescibacteria group bacterium]|nr:hypothetical protein [Patescibacteria group bacterium]